MSAFLSIIIPFGLSKERIYIKDRVIEKAKNLKSNAKIEYIFVEGYSSLENNLEQVIKENGHLYLKDESQKDHFSQGKCRNLGTCFANASVVMFLDVDCYVSLFSLEKILNLITIKNITQNINEFLVLPVVYLSQYGSELIYKQDVNLWDDLIKNDLISGKQELINFYSLVSSTVVLNKYQFLKLGGYSDEFIGHSYEDFDFLARLIYNCVRFEKQPKMLEFDEGDWNLNSFRGFRAWFSLLGEEMSFHGIYMYHFYHEEPNQNNYMSNRRKNHKKFYKNLSDLKNYHLNPLENLARQEKIQFCEDKKYIVLKSLVYDRYRYEIKQNNFFNFFNYFLTKLSHTKIYRIIKRKFYAN